MSAISNLVENYRAMPSDDDNIEELKSIIGTLFDKSDEYDVRNDNIKSLPEKAVKIHMDAWKFFERNYIIRILNSSEYRRRTRMADWFGRNISAYDFFMFDPIVKGDVKALMIGRHDVRFKQYVRPERKKKKKLKKNDVVPLLAMNFPCVVNESGRLGHVTGYNARGFYRVSIIPTEDWQKRYRRWMRAEDFTITGKDKLPDATSDEKDQTL